MFRVTCSLGFRASAIVQSRYASRNIFTANALGIAKLDNLRDRKTQMFTGESRKRYIERITHYLESNDFKSIYKEDLINLIGIAESNDDLDLIERLLENSSEEQRNFYIGWGTVVMRLYYKMNQADRALSILKDFDKFGDFFNMISCYKIVMTMLYDSQQYEKVVDLYYLSQQRLKDTSLAKDYAGRLGLHMFPSTDLSLPTFAALAKINTPDAYEKARAMLSSFQEKKMIVGLRSTSLVAYMALMNGDPTYALNLISSIRRRNYVSLWTIKILALLQTTRYDDVLLLMRELASRPAQIRLLKTTFEELSKAKNNIQDEAITQELDDILIEIKEGNHISEETLEEIIFRPIDLEKRRDVQRHDASSFPSDRHDSPEFQSDRRPRRPDRFAGTQGYKERENKGFRDKPEKGGPFSDGRKNRQFSYQNVDFEARS